MKLSKNPLTRHLQVASRAASKGFGSGFAPTTPPSPSYPVKALHRWRYLAKVVVVDGQKIVRSGRGRVHFLSALDYSDPVGETEHRMFARGGWLWVGR